MGGVGRWLGGCRLSCQCTNSHRRIPFTPRSPNSLLLCPPTLMREKSAHYGHWCFSNECLFSMSWTICLAPDTESHGHGHPPSHIHLFMGLNQACDGPRIPSTGSSVIFTERVGPVSLISKSCPWRDIEKLPRRLGRSEGPRERWRGHKGTSKGPSGRVTWHN